MHGGAPCRGHGGILAAIFDEFAGLAPRMVGVMAATARLTVNYRAPIPIGEPLRLRVWVRAATTSVAGPGAPGEPTQRFRVFDGSVAGGREQRDPSIRSG